MSPRAHYSVVHTPFSLLFTHYPIQTLSISFPNFTASHSVGVAQAKPACKHTIATRKCYQYNTIHTCRYEHQDIALTSHYALYRIVLYVCCRYEHQDIALTCGMMLRECCRHEELARIVLHSEKFYNFFTYVEMSTFDIASDAFSTFKVQ